MAGILKNQLVKRLACFTKGLSVDKIDLDILSGRGYLDNLELDEQFMSSVLELPQWMCFTKILCSKIRLKVSFTKLKSEPIRIFIDTVFVEAEIGKQCNRQAINVQQELADAGLAANGPTSYGYVEQVIDGMHITVSTLTITVQLQHQYLTTELNGVELVSTNRKWKPDDLRRTRAFVMPGREEVLVYKMLTVNHAKFEFFDKSLNTANDMTSAPPLKFNFNMIQLLITMKKLVATNEVVSACLKLILDDILLVFTPSQLQVLLAFSKELSEVIELSAPPAPAPAPKQQDKTRVPTPTKSFMQRFSRQQEEEDTDENVVEVVSDNVLETSYHLKTGTIDILLCDDENSSNPGSLQFRFEVVQIELFPHRTGNASRRHWAIPTQYVKDAQIFAAEMLGDYCENTPSSGNPLQNLYEMVVVLRCEHFQLLPVMGIKKRQILGPLLFSDKTKFGISESEPALVVTIATYYGDKSDSLVPPQNVYVHLNPTEINFDTATMWWVREFISCTLTEDFRLMLTELSKDESKGNYRLKVTLVLPHVTIPLSTIEPVENGQIKGVQLWFSQLTIANLNNAMYLPLLSLLQECLDTPLFSTTSQFPNKPHDSSPFTGLQNRDLIPGIIEELLRHEKLKQELQEEKMRQRRNHGNYGNHGNHVSSVSPVTVHSSSHSTNNSSPEQPGTPQSRRSSISSVNISDSPFSSSPTSSLPDLFPLFNNLLLGFTFDSFSADFLYATDNNSGEKHRSRRFISDVPLHMWLIEEITPAPSTTPSDVTTTPSDVTLENGHRRLTRNTLRRQETLTSPATDYLILMKCSKSVHCTLDRDQYLFLLRLNQEMTSFVERIILSVTQIFTTNVQDSSSFKMVALLSHVMLDLTLPEILRNFVSSRTTSPPDTASTSLSHLTSDSPSIGSRKEVLAEEDIVLLESNYSSEAETDQKTKLNWIVLNRADSNIATLSERLSCQSEDDAVSISSITSELNPLAKGDSKETLLKFIMRVNKKKDTASIGVQTSAEDELVAHNYQQLHAVNARLLGDQGHVTSSRNPGVTSRDQLQVHCGETALLLHSARDVITKITCRRLLVLDEEFISKPRDFPLSRWHTSGSDSTEAPQVNIRIELSPTEMFKSNSSTCLDNNRTVDDVVPHSSDVITPQTTLYQMHCEVNASSLFTSLKDRTLEGLSVFFEPDPTIASIPLTVTCSVKHCHLQLQVGAAQQNLHVLGVKARLKEDESWEIGEDETDFNELQRLRAENDMLREKLRLLSLQVQPNGSRSPGG
ncbi:hypothetical protein ACHWQZ_G015065 [Mnemiopsis leidyi]